MMALIFNLKKSEKTNFKEIYFKENQMSFKNHTVIWRYDSLTSFEVYSVSLAIFFCNIT